MDLRVLIAIEAGPFKEALTSALKRHGSHLQVRMVDPPDMTMEALRFDAHLVIFDDNAAQWPPGVIPTWIKVLDRRLPVWPMFVSIDGEERYLERAGVEDLLTIVDRIERRVLGRENQPHK